MSEHTQNNPEDPYGYYSDVYPTLAKTPSTARADTSEAQHRFRPGRRTIGAVTALVVAVAVPAYALTQPDHSSAAKAKANAAAPAPQRPLQSVFHNGVIDLTRLPTTIPKAVAADAASAVTLFENSGAHKTPRGYDTTTSGGTGYMVHLAGKVGVMTAGHVVRYDGGDPDFTAYVPDTIVAGNDGGNLTSAQVTSVQVPPKFSAAGKSYGQGANIDLAFYQIDAASTGTPDGFKVPALQVAPDQELSQVKPGTVVYQLGLGPAVDGGDMLVPPAPPTIIEDVVCNTNDGNRLALLPVANLTYPDQQPAALGPTPGDSGSAVVLPDGDVIGTFVTVTDGNLPPQYISKNWQCPKIVGAPGGLLVGTATRDDPANLAVLNNSPVETKAA